jgi:predicted TIM-barrel fold metal-dependent hydrolase
MIIDFHIHYLPNNVSAGQMLETMAQLNIEKSVVLATPDHQRYTRMQLVGTNEKVLELCKKYPDKLIPACYIEPRNIMEAQTQIQRFYGQGVRLLKMWPGHGFSPDNPIIYPVWEVINKLKMGVIFHSGSLGVRTNLPLEVRRSTGFNAKYGQPFLFDHPARCFPDIKFIIAHGAYP